MLFVSGYWFGHVLGSFGSFQVQSSAERVMILFLLRRDDGHSRPDVKREYSQCGYEPPLLTSGQPRGCGSDGVADCEGTAQGLKGMTLGETTRWKSRDFTRCLLL